MREKQIGSRKTAFVNHSDLDTSSLEREGNFLGDEELNRVVDSRNGFMDKFAGNFAPQGPNQYGSNRHFVNIQESLNNSLGSYKFDDNNNLNNSFLENSFISNGHFQYSQPLYN
jgi:hypothetical protein